MTIRIFEFTPVSSPQEKGDFSPFEDGLLEI
jgi:hypothetical protein